LEAIRVQTSQGDQTWQAEAAIKSPSVTRQTGSPPLPSPK